MLLNLVQSAAANGVAGYSPASDITVQGVCFLVFILLTQTYVSSKKRVRLAILMLVFTAITCYSNMLSMVLISRESPPVTLIYILRSIRHVTLAGILFFYNSYLAEPLWIPMKTRHINYVLSIIAQIVILSIDISMTINGTGYHITDDGVVKNGINVYTYLFMFHLTISFYRLIRYRKRIIRKIFWCLLFSNTLCIVMMSVQGKHHQTSFTSIAFFLPVLCLIFMFHSNPYDTDTGALAENFFFEDLNNAIEKNKPMVIVSCTITDFFKVMKESNEIKHEYRKYFRQNFQRGTAYRFTHDRLVYMFPKKTDLDKDQSLSRMINDFSANYDKFGIDYKLIVAETNSESGTSLDVANLIYFVEKSVETNSVYRITEDDVKKYNSTNTILKHLESIHHTKDLDDPRVLVYCQPVYDIASGRYEIAEALMRLELDGKVVYPDQFIPLAEQNGFIHTLSLIILNKTCAAIHSMIEKGFRIERISVNFSTIDLRYDSLCDEVKQIINKHGIPLSKIAIEITESRNDSDFNIMIQKVTQLRKLGIKFYLDDFGTGYSNFERIMEIPFDTIKFDRSMLIESNKNENSFYMVNTFAKMFSDLNYSVLFEGVEVEEDESKCRSMNAKYLQGYKYSKPIPIENLVEFLTPAN